jgi:hypothetical protein
MNSNFNLRPLSNEEIQKVAPSVFSGQAYHKMSSRYATIPTIDVVDALRSAGFQPVKASQSMVRLEDKTNFAKHNIRFRSTNLNITDKGDFFPEVSLTNSFDGSSSYILNLAMMVVRCLNGLVVADSFVNAVRIRHVGDILNRVVLDTNDLISNAPKLAETVKLWKTITLSAPEQMALATSAHTLRFDEGSRLAVAITPDQMLKPRRYDDNGNSLWDVFNRVQEGSVRGGLRGLDNGGTEVRRVRTREVKGIDQSTKLNKALWSLAEKMAELKGAAIA